MTLANETEVATTARPNTPPRRLIIWGPGELGGLVLKAALLSHDFDVVGVRAFSPHKIGADIGTLVGLDPVGVRATDSVAEILALDADCVIYTPLPRVMLEGMYQQVDDLLASGKNVVSAFSHYNPGRSHWLSRTTAPSELLRVLAQTEGKVPVPGVGAARAVLRPLMAATHSRGLRRMVLPLIDRLLEPRIDRFLPRELTGEQVEQTCRTAGVSVLGTGVHPGYVVEQLGLTMAGLLDRAASMRLVEAGDAAMLPEGGWGGLEWIGFGSDPASINARHVLARVGDVGYADVHGNVAHALHNAGADDVRIETEMRGLPSPHEVVAAGLTIKAGTTGVLHMVHHGYLEDQLVFTNEEVWFAGSENAYYGEGLPFGGNGSSMYTFRIDGAGARLDAQTQLIAHEGVPELVALADAAGHAILDAIGPVCDSEPGIVLHDARPRYKLVPATDGAGSTATAVGVHRIAVWGDCAVADAVRKQADARKDTEVVDNDPDCVVAIGEDATAMVVEALTRGINVVTDRVTTSVPLAACRAGGATLHVAGAAGGVVADRLIPVLARAVVNPVHVRFIDSVEVSRMTVPDESDIVDPVAAVLGIDPTGITVEVETVVATDMARHVIRRGYLGDQHVLTHEICRYIRSDNAVRGEDLPFGKFTGPQCYTIVITGERVTHRSQIQITPTTSDDPAAALVASALLDAVGPTCLAAPGVLMLDTSPAFHLDDRVQRRAPRP